MEKERGAKKSRLPHRECNGSTRYECLMSVIAGTSTLLHYGLVLESLTFMCLLEELQ